MIPSLQSLRGIFALLIFFHHFKFTIGGESMFAAGGDCGVTFFFILSGFVMCQGYADRVPSVNFKDLRIYLTKRISKIYPLHIMCLAWAMAIGKSA